METQANRIEIIRDYKKDGTYSKINCILNDEKVECSIYGLELKWLDNKPEKSCIPEGRYMAIKSIYYNSDEKYICLEILKVPKRKYIKVHSANYTRQLRGCIAPAMSFADIDGDGIVDGVSSRKALKILMNYVDLVGQDYIQVIVK